MIIDFLIAFAAALCLFVLLQYVKDRLLSFVPKADNITLRTVVSVSGPAPELEATVRAIRWLHQSGRLRTEIVLRNCGMDAETALIAEKLAQRGDVKLIF